MILPICGIYSCIPMNYKEIIRKLKALGLDKLYIHTDGWGKDGYDTYPC